MRIIPTKVHGVLDYLVGLLLIAAPWAFGFAQGGAETWVPVVLGAGALVYSLITDYELGVVRAISMRTHLVLDAMSGLLLLASPWIFGFADRVYVPHVVLGAFEILAALMTQTARGGSVVGGGAAVQSTHR
jgi:hypothetical protein